MFSGTLFEQLSIIVLTIFWNCWQHGPGPQYTNPVVLNFEILMSVRDYCWRMT